MSIQFPRRALFGAAAAGALPRFAIGQPARRAVTVGVQANPVLLDPAVTESNVAYRVLFSIHESPLAYVFEGGTRRLVPALAESWRRIDWRTVELTLRQGAKFHDGTPVTVEDFAFSISRERQLAAVPGAAPTGRAYWSHLDRTEILDRNTVRVHVTDDDIMLEHRLANWTSEIVSARAFHAAPNALAFARNPIGAGPFKLAEMRPDDQILLVPHDEYWGGRPNLSSLRFRVMPELGARTAALASGEAQIVTEVSPDQSSVIERDPRLEMVGSPINNHRLIVYSSIETPALRDPRVRRALNLALDRKLLVDSLLGGRTVAPRSLQFEFYGDMYLADFPEYRQDLPEARRLLREAGYRGEPINYRTLNNYYTAEIALAQACQAMWQQAGINVQLQLRENWTQIMAMGPERGIRNWSNTAVFPDPLSSLSRQHGTNAIQGPSREWSNAEFDALAPVLNTSTNLEERRRAFRRMLTLWEIEDPCGTVIHQNFILYGKRRDLAWQPYPLHLMDFRPSHFTGA
jgi:peptide/nickel transport system substrate-binding protein